MIPSALLRQMVSIEPYLGETASGPDFGDAVTVAGRLRPSRRWVSTTPGSDALLSDATLELRPQTAIGVGDRITCEGEIYRVMAVAEHRGLSRAEFIAADLSRSET